MKGEFKPVSRFHLVVVHENGGWSQDILALDADWALMFVPHDRTDIISVSLTRTHKDVILADFGSRANAQEYLDEHPERKLL